MALKASVPAAKMAKKESAPVFSPEEGEGSGEEYELMPHEELASLRDQLRKLKSLPAEAGGHAQASFEELSRKMDRLIEIFTEAEHELKIEEGAVSFKEKMAPLVSKMDKVLEQNSEIAEGVVALADILTEIKDKLEVGVIYRPEKGEQVGRPQRIAAPPRQQMPGMMPPPPGQLPPIMPRQGMMPPGMPGQAPGMMPPGMQGQMQPGMMPPPPRPMAPLPGAYPQPPRKKGLF